MPLATAALVLMALQIAVEGPRWQFYLMYSGTGASDGTARSCPAHARPACANSRAAVLRRRGGCQDRTTPRADPPPSLPAALPASPKVATASVSYLVGSGMRLMAGFLSLSCCILTVVINVLFPWFELPKPTGPYKYAHPVCELSARPKTSTCDEESDYAPLPAFQSRPDHPRAAGSLARPLGPQRDGRGAEAADGRFLVPRRRSLTGALSLALVGPVSARRCHWPGPIAACSPPGVERRPGASQGQRSRYIDREVARSLCESFIGPRFRFLASHIPMVRHIPQPGRTRPPHSRSLRQGLCVMDCSPRAPSRCAGAHRRHL